ncbi:chorismate transformation enzyme, FkbO/Hyg5 family [Sediminicola luteus]|uniref:Chorismatase FkbO/Hyg5-like N-terminal domain-containing protein n=1 Tax=Sediminicola luteus TaxID=319238 RepID=A0A2A4G295_9FLAO|nr:hypothetical protein [Sediminicola luteus]PCE63099.1 hypothetical protein B7P33_17665 [Sediminicola luteus]
MLQEKIHTYIASPRKSDLHSWVAETLDLIKPWGTVVKVNLFFGAIDSFDFFRFRQAVLQEGEKRWPKARPVLNCIGQSPVAADLMLEVITLKLQGCQVRYHTETPLYAITIKQEGQTHLYTSYASETAGFDSKETSENAMQDLGQTLDRLGFGRQHIKRQWNYIERITHCTTNGQHYQNFNNSRAAFFDQIPWPYGYPAATGIGTSYGGLVIDTLAVKGVPLEIALDNPLQQAAHGYSEQVLVGHSQKQTPKFERAKCICDATSGMLYISGTAAIRGEASLAQADVIEQTQITLENIKAVLEHADLPIDLDGHPPKMRGEVARVYLKNPSDWSVVKPLCHAFFGDRIIPLHADVCRPSLLIEIEATYSFIKNLKHEKNPVSLTGAGLDLRSADR